MCYKDRAINRVNLNYKLYFTFKYAGFLFKGCCIFRLPLTHGHSSKYHTILSAFILLVQTFYSTFMRFKAISIRVQYSILAECARSNKPPCCEKTLYHNCVFNCINWITGGEKVTVLEWKWWATVSGAASIPTLTGKQSNWFSMASCRTVQCHISSLNADHSRCLQNRQAVICSTENMSS